MNIQDLKKIDIIHCVTVNLPTNYMCQYANMAIPLLTVTYLVGGMKSKNNELKASYKSQRVISAHIHRISNTFNDYAFKF